jgi:AraC-like DNA-binding protein
MANATKKDQRGYIDFSNLIVDYTDGDIIAFDRIKDIRRLYPLKPMSNMIVFCRDGQMRVKAHGRSFELKGGDVLICPPNVRIDDSSFSDSFDCKVICLSDHIIQGLLRDRIEVWHQAVYINQLNIISTSEIGREEFGFYFSIIRSKIQNYNQLAPKEIMLALVRAFLLELCFMLEDSDSMEKEQKLSQGKLLFNRYLSLVSNSDVKRQPITYYASQLAITPKYLTMLCLKYSDKTASEWVIQYTLEEIRFYLKSSNLSIKEISAKLGFSNMSHFGSYVRKHLGMSPSQFRHGK